MLIQRSPPCKLVWGAWSAYSHDMERMGWEFERNTASYDFMRGQVEIAFRDRRTGVAGLAVAPEQDLMRAVTMDGRYSNRDRDWTPEFEVRTMNFGKSTYLERAAPALRFSPVSMEPEFVEVKSVRLSDIFAARQVPAEEIIADPKTVASMLEEIRKMQEPELAAIRAKNRLRDPTRHLQEQPAPEWVEEIPAQIISMRRAA